MLSNFTISASVCKGEKKKSTTMLPYLTMCVCKQKTYCHTLQPQKY